MKNKLVGNPTIPQALEQAIDYVKKHHPTLSIIVFDRNCQWCYMDEYFRPLLLDEGNHSIFHVSILEAASEAIANSSHPLPCVFQLQDT